MQVIENNGEPGRIRTFDLMIRSHLAYKAESIASLLSMCKPSTIKAQENQQEPIGTVNQNAQQRPTFDCPEYPNCGCPPETVKPDCPALKKWREEQKKDK